MSIYPQKLSDLSLIYVIEEISLQGRPFAIGVSGKGGGSLPPHATVGKPWKFALGLPKGTKVVIEDSPDGVSYDAATGSLSWPAPTTKGVGEILLSITKPGEEEYYKEYKVFVK